MEQSIRPPRLRQHVSFNHPNRRRRRRAGGFKRNFSTRFPHRQRTSNPSSSYSKRKGTDFCFVKISSVGALQWNKTYGGVNDDDAYALENSNGNVIFNNDVSTKIYASFDELREGGYWTGGNFAGIYMNSSSNDLICGNTLHDNLECIVLHWTTNTIVAGNNMTESNVSILGNSVWSNQFYMNNFVDTSVSQFTYGGSDASDEGLQINTTNAWDNGQAGNFWSNYQQTYPSAQQNDSSGTWSKHYAIAPNNTDNFPLINPISADTASALSQNLISNHLPSAGLSPILPASVTPTPEATYAGQTSTATPASEPLIIAAVLAAAIILVVVAVVELRRRANRGRRETAAT